jgi:hypothetical protein
MPAFRGKTLWFSALALWLTASPAGGKEADASAHGAPAAPPAVEETHAAPPYALYPDEAVYGCR